MLLRWFLLAGWRGVLGLRLGPLHDPAYVHGWQISAAETNRLTLNLDSWLIEAVNIIDVESDQVAWTTKVVYRRLGARLLWAFVLPIHKLTIPYVLRRAAARRAPSDRS
ncbi:hypothetical protein [Kribbella sp. NPDC051137]|uniref:hypothetical protein n=1 Tax=Kribbella sp. NPDC051137 TaxID=3155045 RepID=UPI002F8EDFD7